MKAQIAFAAFRPHERILKISYALRKFGISTIGVFQQPHSQEDYGRYFDFVRFEQDPGEIANILNRSSVEIVHLFSMLFDPVASFVFRFCKKKIVYDPKDVFQSILSLKEPDGYVESQVILLQRCAGLVLRDGQAWLSARLSGYKLAQNKMLFPDYCWSKDLIYKYSRPGHKYSKKLVLAGTFSPERAFPERSAGGYIQIARELLRQDFDITFFPIWNTDYSEYIELASNSNGKMRILPPVPDSELLSELTKYDFGLVMTQGHLFDGMSAYWRKELMRYGAPSRASTYLSSGIPILATDDILMHRILCGMKCGVAVSRENLRNLGYSIDGLQYEEMRKKVGCIRLNKLSIDNQIHKLVSFYLKL
jgi:hypothetical protein